MKRKLMMLMFAIPVFCFGFQQPASDSVRLWNHTFVGSSGGAECSGLLTFGGREIGTHINPYVAATLKSQFADGLVYDDQGKGTVVSAMFDPLYLMQSAGVGYQPIPRLKTRLGAALREIVTSVYTAYSDDPTTVEIEKTRVDGGVESVTEPSGSWRKMFS